MVVLRPAQGLEPGQGRGRPWWGGNSKEAYSSGLADLATALGNWDGSRTGKRRGRKVRFPRFRGKRAGLSCRFTTGTSLAVLSTGEVITNPKHLEVARRELRRLQRRAARRVGPDRRTGRASSARWRRTQTRIGRLHTHVANARRDGLHTPSTRLVRTHATIVLEDLNVAGMTRNRRLARHIAGVGMAEPRRQVEYKAHRSGVHVHIADHWYPSSKTCSGCGVVKAKLRLSERVYRCESCGLVLDRDLNAARNLAALVEHTSSPSRGATPNEPAGNPRKTTARGATGTATGTATGRPAPTGTGQRRHGNVSTA